VLNSGTIYHASQTFPGVNWPWRHTKINKNLPSESHSIHTFAFLPYPFDPFFVPCDFYSIWNSMGGMGTQRTVTQRCDNKRSAKRGAHSVSPPPSILYGGYSEDEMKGETIVSRNLKRMKTPGQCPPKEIVWQVIERKKKNLQDLLYTALNPFNNQSEKNNNFYTVRSHNRWNSNCSGRWGYIKLAADPPKIIFRDCYMYVRSVWHWMFKKRPDKCILYINLRERTLVHSYCR
jgi:hypothetical protein